MRSHKKLFGFGHHLSWSIVSLPSATSNERERRYVVFLLFRRGFDWSPGQHDRRLEVERAEHRGKMVVVGWGGGSRR